jgi:ring-1,2-phenylacetyl-CoA epoxidase subunit PaaA
MTNDELRQAFLNSYMPKAKKYSLEIPDEPRIREEGGRYVVVDDDLDWDEFFAIAKNEYEPGRGQIDERAAAREAVSWVRNVLDSQEEAVTGGGTPAAAD